MNRQIEQGIKSVQNGYNDLLLIAQKEVDAIGRQIKLQIAGIALMAVTGLILSVCLSASAILLLHSHFAMSWSGACFLTALIVLILSTLLYSIIVRNQESDIEVEKVDTLNSARAEVDRPGEKNLNSALNDPEIGSDFLEGIEDIKLGLVHFFSPTQKVRENPLKSISVGLIGGFALSMYLKNERRAEISPDRSAYTNISNYKDKDRTKREPLSSLTSLVSGVIANKMRNILLSKIEALIDGLGQTESSLSSRVERYSDDLHAQPEAKSAILNKHGSQKEEDPEYCH